MNVLSVLKNYVKQHKWFILAAITLGVCVSFFFLFNQSAGEGWAMNGLPLDDNWIHLVYARSLAEEGWFFYNHGQAEAGMSSPLWVILLSIVLLMGGGPVFSAKILSILLGTLFSILCYHLVIAFKLPKVLAWMAGLFVIIEPNLSFARVSGMEVMLTGCTLVAALLAANSRKYLLTGFMIGLMVISRGELALVGIILGGALILELVLSRKSMELFTLEEIKTSVKVFLPPLVLGGLWAAYNFSVNGHPLPNTYYVKHYYDLGLMNLQNLGAIWQGYFQHSSLFMGFMGIVLIPVYGMGMFYFVKKKNLIGVLTALVPLVIIYSLSINMKMGPENWNFFARRYLDFLLPLLFIGIMVGFLLIWEKIVATDKKIYRIGFSIFLLAVVVNGVVNTGGKLFALADEYSWNCRNIEEVDVAMGKWINANLPESAVIGVSDAGAMRYFGNRYTIDFLGLNDHRNMGQPLAEIMGREKPDYVALFRTSEFDSWKYLKEVKNFSAERNTILGGADLVLFQVDKNLLP